MILILLLAVIAACLPSFVALHHQWVDLYVTTHTHGYLIVAVCLWLLWRDRQARAATPAQPRLAFLAPLAIAAAVWLVAVRSGLQALEFAVLPALLWCAVLAGYGFARARRFFFPTFYFYLATPLWVFFNGFFQWTSIYAVRVALRTTGIPAFFDGNRVQLPAGTFEIAGGCSGIHFAVVGVAIAALLGELRGDDGRRRIKLVLLAISLAMVTNWIRVFTIILAGHYTHMQHYLVTRSHYGYGWVLFGVAMAVFFFIESRMKEGVARPGLQPAASMKQVVTRAVSQRMAIVAVFLLLGVMALWQALAARPAMQPFEALVLQMPWSRQASLHDAWQPRFVGADEQWQASYARDDGSMVSVYQALYRSQRQGKELGGYYNDVLGGAQVSDIHAAVINRESQVVYRVADAGNNQSLIAATYEVRGRHFVSTTSAQLWYALNSLWRLRSPISAVTVRRTDCRPDCQAAEKVLLEIKD